MLTLESSALADSLTKDFLIPGEKRLHRRPKKMSRPDYSFDMSARLTPLERMTSERMSLDSATWLAHDFCSGYRAPKTARFGCRVPKRGASVFWQVCAQEKLLIPCGEVTLCLPGLRVDQAGRIFSLCWSGTSSLICARRNQIAARRFCLITRITCRSCGRARRTSANEALLSVRKTLRR
jgi:hypothetical protein